MSTPGVAGERSAKDVLSHIALWHSHAVTLLFRAERGQPLRLRDEPASDALQADPRPFENVWADFEGAHRQLVRRLRSWQDEPALFSERRDSAFRGQSLAEVIRQYAVARPAECRRLLEGWMSKEH
jgi:hypothetical protein